MAAVHPDDRPEVSGSLRSAALHPVNRVAVIVPAHNEETTLPSCITALQRAADEIVVPVTVVVVLDSCTDGSAVALAKQSAPGVRLQVIAVNARNVGAARERGCREALHLLGPDQGVWLATTDADSMVPASWLRAQLDHAAAGAHMVAGTVTVSDWEDRCPLVRDRAISDYLVGPHRHVHGANLSFSAAAYRRSGGFAPLRSDEDVDLVERFRVNNEAIAWALDLPVTTSARRHGRAPRGFAAYLSSLETGLDSDRQPHAAS